jgi:insulysin
MLQDPPGYDGLAHFCEHMLFMGTKQFPAENYYSAFIQSHGGESNASTGEDFTNYYFSVKNDKFKEALNIYSSFFKNPLFDKSCVDREVKIID